MAFLFFTRYAFCMRIEEISPQHEAAFLAMIDDYKKNDPAGLHLYHPRKSGWTPTEFQKFVKESAAERMDWLPKANAVSVTRYVLPENDRLLACGLMRFPLDEDTEIDGGNLFVDVPPSLRGQGNGSYCLSLLLFEAVRAGLRRVLTTCPSSDAAAKRVIEKNRGTLFDEVESAGKSISRYWISFR